MTEETTKIILCVVLVAAGLFTHLVAKLKELEDRGTEGVSLKKYVFGKPWTMLNVVLSAYALLLIAYLTGELGPMGSFCFGVAANVAGDKVRASAEKKVAAQGGP